MPSFFQFTQGTESRVRPTDTSPLLGRYRAVPPRDGVPGRRRSSPLGLLAGRGGVDRGGSVHVGYAAAALAAAGLGSDDDGDEDDDEDDDEGGDEDGDGGNGVIGLGLRRGRKRGSRARWQQLWKRWVTDLWVHPRQSAVRRVVERWWSRYGALVFLPAALAVAWCAVPFPKYPIADAGYPPSLNGTLGALVPLANGSTTPGHGAARVRVNFWFFLVVYYGFYNLTALIWITKVFNLYSLNWWPRRLGFPLTVSLIAVVSMAVPIPVYLSPRTRPLIAHNTSWISWTFIIMALPVAIAFVILTTNERHMGLRHSLSETQRIFTTSWWTGEPDPDPDPGLPRRGDRRHRRRLVVSDDALESSILRGGPAHRPRSVSLRRRWLPASFVRFLWFCVALFIGLMAYVLGEAYAEIYLRTLPHDSLETVVYVYGWVVTVHLLDALTGWVLGIKEGERVGSYPLSWVFKLYFMLTYQTYVRALYARLRSPQQFVILQILSSTGLVVVTPLMMTRLVHRALTVLGLNAESYASYQKIQARNVFIRFLAENASMAAFLGSVLVLHFGPNKDVYPYFAFDHASDPEHDYDFNLTYRASAVTWACELVASLVVRALIRLFFAVDVGLEGRLDLAVWPELLPTAVAVMLHVLQNMLFSIIRLQF